MGRYLARAIRSAMLSDLALQHWQLLTDNILKGDDTTYNPPQFPQHEVEGVGMHEAPRGTLSHWVVIDKGAFSNYQAVVPTTWNASPRDEKGVPGPYESSLLGKPGGRSGEAAGSPPHRALLRSVHGVRVSHARCKWARNRSGESLMSTSTGRQYAARIAIIGLGNVLLGDDGFGPLAVEMFRCEYECGSNVEILDLGTPGLDLAPYLYGTDLVVIADAVHADEKPGTLCIYCEADLLARRAQLRLTAHDPGVQESLAQLRLAGHAPSELIIVGVVPESCDLRQRYEPFGAERLLGCCR